MDVGLPDRLAGAVLDGRYRIAGIVARGGMAIVYRALDLKLERVVAVKVLDTAAVRAASDEQATAELTSGFHREAKTIARLSHPHVVAVYDHGVHRGLPYLVMEYVPGRTLRHLLAERRLAPAEALELFESVTRALAAAHRAGLAHRDVKPENVLLGDDGMVKVADFGLAHAVEAATEPVSGGYLLATVAYVSPEQVTSGRSDARSDVYSAGIMLFEMLTGRLPYRADSPERVARLHVERDVPPPSEFAPGLHPTLDDLVRRATHRDPDARPADAGALLDMLRAAREEVGTTGADAPALARDGAAGHAPANAGTAGPAPASAALAGPAPGNAVPAGPAPAGAGTAHAATAGPAPARPATTRRLSRQRRSTRLLLAGAACVAAIPVLFLVAALGLFPADPRQAGVDQTTPPSGAASPTGSPKGTPAGPRRSGVPERSPSREAPARTPGKPDTTPSRQPSPRPPQPSCPPEYSDEWWYDYCR